MTVRRRGQGGFGGAGHWAKGRKHRQMTHPPGEVPAGCANLDQATQETAAAERMAAPLRAPASPLAETSPDAASAAAATLLCRFMRGGRHRHGTPHPEPKNRGILCGIFITACSVSGGVG